MLAGLCDFYWYFYRDKIATFPEYIYIYIHTYILWVWVQPIRDDVIMWRRLSLAEPIHIMIFVCVYVCVCVCVIVLTHWGRVMHICVNKLAIIGSDNGLSPGRRQAIIWTSAAILLIGPSGTNLSETLIEICTFSFKKMHLKMSGKWRPFCLGLKVLTHWGLVTPYGDRDLGQHWVRQWLVAWWHQAVTRTNVDLS